MRTLNHFGVPVNYKPEGAMYNEGLNVWLTDFSKSANKIELSIWNQEKVHCQKKF